MRSTVCSPDSSIYVTGVFQKTLSIGSLSLTSKGGNDIFIARFTSSGSLMWLESIGSKGEDEVGDICMNGTDIALTGSVSDTTILSAQVFPRPKKESLFVAKYYKNGLLDDVLFADPANTPGASYLDFSSGLEIERDGTGDFVLIMGLLGGVQLDTAHLYGGGYSWEYEGCFVIKLTSGLKFKWIVGPQYNPDAFYSLHLNSQDDIFFIQHGAWHYYSHSSIRKLSPAGTGFNNSFLKQYPHVGSTSTYGYAGGNSNRWNVITIDSCDNIYFTGNATRWFYSGQPTDKYFFETGQISPLGQLNWLQRDSSWKDRTGTGIIDLSPNNVVLAGFFCDTLLLKNKLTGTYPTPYYGYTVTLGTFLAGLQTTVGIPGNVTPSGNQLICLGKTATLIAQSAGSIAWFQNSSSANPLDYGSTFTASPLSAGIYTCFAEASTCTSTTGRAPFTFTVMPLPQLSVNSGTICDKQSFTISPAGAVAYTFSAGAPVVTPSVTNAYTITGVANNNCTATAVSYVTVNPLPNIIVSAGQNYSCVGETVTLTCSGAANYTWNTGSNSTYTVISPIVPVSFTVEGTSAEGCYSKVTHLHKVAPCLGVGDRQQSGIQIFPNPGNGVFTLTSVTAGELMIYNASGQLVMRQNINEGENKINISALPAGVYYCNYRDHGGLVTSRSLIRQ